MTHNESVRFTEHIQYMRIRKLKYNMLFGNFCTSQNKLLHISTFMAAVIWYMFQGMEGHYYNNITVTVCCVINDLLQSAACGQDHKKDFLLLTSGLSSVFECSPFHMLISCLNKHTCHFKLSNQTSRITKTKHLLKIQI